MSDCIFCKLANGEIPTSMVAENELARRVKVADLRHNCDLTRLDAPTERDRERIRKYHKALEVLGEHV